MDKIIVSSIHVKLTLDPFRKFKIFWNNQQFNKKFNIN